MALATRGTNFCKEDVVRYEWELAKELGHQHHGPRRDGPLRLHEDAAARSRRWTCSTRTRRTSTRRTCSTTSGTMVRDSGGNVSLAPQIELQMGHGWAPAQTASKLGIPVGLSSDVATTASADQFTQMHAIFASERGRRHAGGLGRGPRRQHADARPDRLAPGPALGDARRRAGRRRRRPDRLDHARQEGRPRDHRHEGGERGAGHRPGRRGRLRGRHLEQSRGRKPTRTSPSPPGAPDKRVSKLGPRTEAGPDPGDRLGADAGHTRAGGRDPPGGRQTACPAERGAGEAGPGDERRGERGRGSREGGAGWNALLSAQPLILRQHQGPGDGKGGGEIDGR